MDRVLAFFKTPLVALMASVLFGAIAVSGHFSVPLAEFLLFIAFVLGVVSIVSEKFPKPVTVATISVLVLGCAFLGYWIWPPEQRTLPPFRAEIRTTYLYLGDLPRSMFMVAYPSMYGPTASPATYLMYVSILNEQPIPSTVRDYSIDVGIDRKQWFNLVWFDLPHLQLYLAGGDGITREIVNHAGTLVFMSSPTEQQMANSDLLTATPLLDVQLGRPIQPHDTIQGWIAFDRPLDWGAAPKWFRITVEDTAGISGVTILPTPSHSATSASLNTGELKLTGLSQNLYAYKCVFYGDTFTRPHVLWIPAPVVSNATDSVDDNSGGEIEKVQILVFSFSIIALVAFIPCILLFLAIRRLKRLVLRLTFLVDWDAGFNVSSALAIFDATECAVCSFFLSAMTQAPEMENVIARVYVPDNRWPEVTAEYGARALYSAACYQQVEHIGVFPMIVSERELGEVQRQIFLRDVMEVAHDAALEQCPKRFNAVRVNNSPHVLI